MTTITEEPLVSTPSKSVVFASRRESLRLVKMPRYDRRDSTTGAKHGETIGQCVVFQNGRLEIPTEGEIVLEDGRTADAAEILQWLEGHRLHGDEWEGFFKVHRAAPAPTRAEFGAVLDAVKRGDRDKLQAIVDQEAAGWNRGELLDPARDALADMPEPKRSPKG